MPDQGKIRQRQVFLSYASEDREAAFRIASALKDAGLKPWIAEWEINAGERIDEKIENALSSSDIVIALFSRKSVNTSSLPHDVELTRTLRDRAIAIVPAMIEPVDIPTRFLGRAFIDLSQNLPEAARQLAEQLNATIDVDFSHLNARDFEKLVSDLLSEFGFKVEIQPASKDGGIDIIASHHARDPFGAVKEETWLVEAKLYREQRVSVSVIRQLLGVLHNFPNVKKGLVVTSGQLTSTARDHANGATRAIGSVRARP